MANAYFSRMHEASYTGTLFEETNWKEMRVIQGLDQVILDVVKRHPGLARKAIWTINHTRLLHALPEQ